MAINERTCKTCAEQIKRLSAKRFWSQLDDFAKRELVRHLHTYAHEPHGEDRPRIVIDEALLRNFGPSGGDVLTTDELWVICREDPRDFESQRKPQPKQLEPNPECPQCGGTGWEEVSRKNGHGVEITGAQRCQNGCAVPARDAA